MLDHSFRFYGMLFLIRFTHRFFISCTTRTHFILLTESTDFGTSHKTLTQISAHYIHKLSIYLINHKESIKVKLDDVHRIHNQIP